MCEAKTFSFTMFKKKKDTLYTLFVYIVLHSRTFRNIQKIRKEFLFCIKHISNCYAQILIYKI